MFSSEPQEINPNILCREIPVLVTGGAGYMASWLVKYLLEDGYKVRITVRSLANEDQYSHLLKIADKSPGNLNVFEANLLEPDAFKHCMNGCNIVFHTASPYLISGVKNPQKELIDPSFKGTHNVLEAVNKASSVRKVIFTSAISAVYGDISDIDRVEEGVFSETQWNKSSNLKHLPLGFAKTVAEKQAWKIHDEQSRWKMAVLNPALMFGPSLTTKSKSGSFDYIIRLANGTYKSGVPDIQQGIVDVRDAAHAHIFAAQDEFALGRFLLVSEVRTMLEVANVLRGKFGESFPFPTEVMSKNMLMLFGFAQGYSRRYVSENVGRDLKFDNKKSRHELGVYYKSIDEAAEELLKHIVENRMFHK